METSSSLDAYEELEGRGKKQKIPSTGGGVLLFVFITRATFCMIVCHYGNWRIFLQVTKFIMFHKVNHSNGLLDSYTNIGT